MANLLRRITQLVVWLVPLFPTRLKRAESLFFHLRTSLPIPHLTLSLQAGIAWFLRQLQKRFALIGSHSSTLPTPLTAPPTVWFRLLANLYTARHHAYFIVIVISLLVPTLSKAQSIPTPAAICPGQSLTLVPIGLPGGLLTVNVTAPAGISVLTSTSTGIVLATSPTLTSGTYNVGVQISAIIVGTILNVNVPIVVNSIPVLSLSSLAGITLGSALNLGSCSVGSVLSYTVLSGPLSGSTGTGGLTFSPALNGQQLSVVCAGGPCPGTPTTVMLPTLALPGLNIPTPAAVCVGQPLSITILPTNIANVAANALSVGISGPVGTTIGALGPDGVVTISGLQSGTSTLTVSLSVLGSQVAQVPVSLVALPLPVLSLSSLTGSTLGSVLNLGSCPVGSDPSFTVLTGALAGTTGTGSLTLLPSLVGQQLSVVCSGGPCPGIPLSLTLPTVALPGLNIPTPPLVCVGQALSLTILPTNVAGIAANAISIGITGPAGTTIGALGPDGVVTISGLQSGTSTLTVSLSVLGSQVAQVPVSLVALPLPVLSLSSLTGSTLGSVLNLGSCPVGSVPSFTVLTGALAGTTGTGSLTLLPSLVGQQLSVVCAGGPCLGIPLSLTLPSVALPGLNIPTPPLVCVGQALSLTILPTNVAGIAANAISIGITGPVGTTIGALGPDGVVTISGLQSGTSTLTVSLSVLGSQVAQVPVSLVALPLPVLSLSSLTGSVLGSVLNLGSCPVGSVPSFTVLTGALAGTTGTGSLTLLPSLVGQQLSVVCAGGPCPGIPLSLTLPSVALPGLNIPTPPLVCVGQALSLTILPTNVAGIAANAISIGITGPVGTTIGALGPDGVVTISGLQSGTSTLTVSLSVLGSQVAQVPVSLVALPLPVLSLSSLTGSTLGSVLNLGSCPVGSVPSFTVLTGALAGTTGTGSLTLLPSLVGQQLSVVCAGGPCLGLPSTIVLPLPSLQTLNLGNLPTSVCVDAPISLTVLPTPGVDLSAVGLAIMASTTSGTLAVSALGPNGALTINGGQLTVGNNQPITITVSLSGVPLASTTFNLNVVQPAIPNQPPTLTALVGSTLSLSGLCPTGTLVNLSNLANLTGIIPIPTTAVGVQSLSILCNDNGCLSPVRVITATVLPLLFNVLNNGPVCLNQPLSLTVLPTNFTLAGTNPLVSISVTGPAGITASALDPNGVLTVTGLTSGVNNLNIVASVAGTPVTTVGLSTTAFPTPNPVVVSSLTVLAGTPISLTALCPTTTVSTTGVGGTTVPLLSLPPSGAGTQVLPLLCAGTGTCISPLTSVTIITLPLPTITLTPSALQVCAGLPVSLTVAGLSLPFGLSVVGIPSAGVTISNDVITVTGLPTGPTTLTVNAGLTVAGVPVLASQTVTITVLSPTSPTVVTQSGQPYPAGVSSLTVAQNSPSVLFNASCSTGTLSYTSSGGTTGTTSPITVPTTATGVVSYSAVCIDGACVSPAIVASVTVVGPVTPGNQPPVLSSTSLVSPQSATVGVAFSTSTAQAFTDPDGGPLTYSSPTLPAGLTISPTTGVISGTPTTVGSFSISVRATDPQNASVSAGFILNVFPAIPTNQNPTLVGTGITDPQTGTVGIPFTSNVATAFTDPDGNPLTFTAIGLPAGLTISPAGLITGTPSVSGSFGVVVTANDGQGGTVSDGFTLNILPNGAPVITTPGDQSLTINVPASFTVVATDPEGGTVTYAATGLPPSLTINPTTGVVTGTPSVTGTFPVTVTVTDPQGNTSTVGFNVVVNPVLVVNQPPTLVGTGITDPQNGTVGVPFTSNVATAFVDPNGNPLTFTSIGLPAGLSISTAGLISGTPTVAGTFAVLVTANDGQGGSVSDNFSLIIAPAPVINLPPTVVGTGITDPQNATVGVPFVSNVAPAFTDPNGNPLTFTAIGLPAGLTISTTGLITGTPSVSGVFGVTVTANDGQGGTVSDNFTLNVFPAPVVNQPPTLVGTGITDPQNATVGVPFTSNVATAFTDPNGNPLTFTSIGLPAGLSISTAGLISGTPTVAGTYGVLVTANDGQGGTVSDNFTLNVFPATVPNQPPTLVGTGITDPQNGTVGVPFTSNVAPAFTDPNGNPLTFTAIGLPPALSISAGGLITGTPSVSGTFAVVVTANDGQGGTVSDNFSLIIAPAPVPNQPPIVVGIGITDPQSGTVGVPFTSNMAPFFTDPDGNPLTFTAIGLPLALSISAGGLITGTPSISGAFGVLVTASDGQGGTVSDSFTLNIFPALAANQPPVLSGTPLASPQSATVGVAFSTSTAQAFTDPDGGPLTYSSPTLPAGLTISPTTGVISGTPTTVGSFSISVRATDPQNASVSAGFILNVFPATVPNRPPTVVGAGITDPQTGTVGVPFTSNVTPFFTDPDGNTLTFTAIGLPPSLSITPAGLITGTPSVSGAFGVLVTANDGQGGTVSDSFTLNILPAPAVFPPLAVTVVAYNCQTGAITFGRIGGDPTRTVEYMAIGVRGYSTDPNAVIESGLRGDPNSSTITVMARYVALNPALRFLSLANNRLLRTLNEPEVSFVFNFRAFCPGTNLPPTLVGSIPNQTATVGISYSYGIPAGTFVDPEGQPLTYSASGMPRGLGFSGSAFSGIPTQEGQFPITVTAYDPQNNFVSTRFILTVIPSSQCGSNPATFGQPLQLTQPTYNCQTGTIKFNVQGGNGSVIEFGAIGITPFQTNCFETMDTEVAQDVRDDKSNVEPFQIMARQNGQTVTYAFDARAYCRLGGAGNPIIGARLAVVEPYGNLRVTVFGNPTTNEQVEVEISGAEGQPLTLRVADGMGKVVGQQFIEKAGATQRYMVPVGKSAGMYFLQVSTPNRVETVKIVRQ